MNLMKGNVADRCCDCIDTGDGWIDLVYRSNVEADGMLMTESHFWNGNWKSAFVRIVRVQVSRLLLIALKSYYRQFQIVKLRHNTE